MTSTRGKFIIDFNAIEGACRNHMKSNFKIQLKVPSASLTSLRQQYYPEQADLWEELKEMINDGKAEISIIEEDNEYKRFPMPEEIKDRDEKWDGSKISNIYIEPDSLFLLAKKTVKDKGKVLKKVLKVINICDCILYSYYYKESFYLGVTWLVNDLSQCPEIENEIW